MLKIAYSVLLMTLLVFFIFLSIGVSFLCSILEAVLLSVTPSYLASLQSREPSLFKKIKSLKDDIEKPLASILTFNTIAHTVGAAGAGAEAQRIFGSETLAVFSAILTFGILFLSEIIPKSIGANSWKSLLPFSAAVIRPMIIISYPLVWMSEKVSSLFRKDREKISRDEISAMADLGLKDGAIESNEYRALKGLIRFEKVRASEIFTPAEKVMSVKINETLKEGYEKIQSHPYSRIVVLGKDGKTFEGYILRNQLLEAYIKNPDLKKIHDLVFSLQALPEKTSLPLLFQKLIQRREHMCAIKNEQSEFIGLITLEDLIEHMLDLEIFDEQDHLNP